MFIRANELIVITNEEEEAISASPCVFEVVGMNIDPDDGCINFKSSTGDLLSVLTDNRTVVFNKVVDAMKEDASFLDLSEYVLRYYEDPSTGDFVTYAQLSGQDLDDYLATMLDDYLTENGVNQKVIHDVIVPFEFQIFEELDGTEDPDLDDCESFNENN